MKEILWISLRAPYERVSHGGGKTHLFYLKSFLESEYFNITLVSFCYDREKENKFYEAKNLNSDIYVIKRNEKIRSMLGRMGLPVSLLEYPYVKKSIYTKLVCLKKVNYCPDIIILHWTEIVMLEKKIKKMFPTSKIVAIEEDVTFLKMMRKVEQAKGFKRVIVSVQKNIILKKELDGLKNADVVALNNSKDYNLVKQYGIEEEKCLLTVPYFENMSYIKRRPQKNKIIFWGAMNRPENIEAVKWFVSQVLPKNRNIDFYVVGANPSEEIIQLESNQITITGFVDNPSDYFSTCMCMVVPLKIGAGIKIKVLEGMSAGIPILTNHIGIEGIAADNNISYIHCESADEYVKAINNLVNSDVMGLNIGENAKKKIVELYDINNDIKKFIGVVRKL